MRLATVAASKYKIEPIWHIVTALLLTVVLQLILRNDLVFGSKYIATGLEAFLIVVLVVPGLSAAIKRYFAMLLVTLIAVANVVSLALVTKALFATSHVNGKQLLISSVAIYLTNIIVFGILYWELDNTVPDEPDFLFPQFADTTTKWQPTFFDYVYVSITNATAFSPTDTLPLTHRAKLLMAVQGIISLVTIVLVTARAVNILG